MRTLVFISLVLLLTDLAITQEYKSHNTFNKDVELQKFVERGGKVEEVSPDVYKLTYRTGESRTFYFGSKENIIENNEPVDTTIINIWEIDTTKFNGMFTFWQQVQVANTEFQLVFVNDINKNGLPELYGHTDYSTIGPIPIGGPVRIFERDLDGIYKIIFTYDSATIFVQGIGDIHRTGGKEIFVRSRLANNGTVYKSDSLGTLPTTYDFLFYYKANQINNMTFGDWDYNGITDCAFIDGAGAQHCIIAEFRDSINNFEELFRFATTEEGDLAGFAIDDFDADGKLEFVVGSGRHGNIYVMENTYKNEYSFIKQFSFPTLNAYMQTVSNDIDENGKVEFWIGGQDFEQGITVYQCYEASDDNSYTPVAKIELRYSNSFVTNYIQAYDIDDDNKEEIIISSGNIILILKFTGTPNNHQYSLWYAKIGEVTQPGAQFFPVVISDLDGDKKKDLLLPFYKYNEPIVYAFSYILRQGMPSSKEGPGTNKISSELAQSYPNPFNSESTVAFSINETSNVQIKIFNTLGKEINLLLDKELSPGNYNISWHAKDKLGNSLPSGVYLIVLKTKNSIKTVKSIFLK